MRILRISCRFAGFLSLVLSLSAQTFTTLHSFDGADGTHPYAGLMQATDGNLYGTTLSGGANGYGTIFKITPTGTLTTLYSFCPESGCTDGYEPWAGLIQGTDGTFYGTTLSGGANNDGTVFSLSMGLGPFVETQPTSGEVGTAVNILTAASPWPPSQGETAQAAVCIPRSLRAG